MLEDFDPSIIKSNPVYECDVCENNNELILQPIIAIGPLDEPVERVIKAGLPGQTPDMSSERKE